VQNFFCLPGLDTTGLAASLPTSPVGLAWHARSSEHMGENKMNLLTGGEQANFVRRDDLKVHRDPTECTSRHTKEKRLWNKTHIYYKHATWMNNTHPTKQLILNFIFNLFI